MKRLTVTGNMGHDPELRTSPEGAQFVTFSVGVNVGNRANPKTDWIDVSCNGRLVDVIMKHAKKGTRVLVDGFPKVNAYLNKDNVPTGNLKLYAHSIELLNRAKDSDNEHDIHEASQVEDADSGATEAISA